MTKEEDRRGEEKYGEGRGREIRGDGWQEIKEGEIKKKLKNG